MANGDPDTAPLVPGNTPSPDVNQQAQTGGLADQWRSWMADPHNRAAMIQFGVALSQPISAGQNALGQIGSAVGQAGEASDRITAEEDKQAEAASKQELRKASAELAGAKAETQGTVASARQASLEAQQQRLEQQGRIAQLNAYVKLQAQYNKMRAEKEKANSYGLTASGKPEPIPTWEEFFSANQGLDPALKGVTAGGPTTVGGVDQKTGLAPVKVSSPAEAQALEPGTPYVTPDGKRYTR